MNPSVDWIINFKLVIPKPKPKPKPFITALFIPLFILVYLLPSLSEHHFVVGSPISAPNDALSKRQNAPPIPLPPPPPPTPFGGNTPTATWTYNYWWPYPPAGAVTATATVPAVFSSPPTSPVPPTPASSQDHVTFVLPITTTTTNTQSSNEDQDQSITVTSATDSTTTNASSTSSTSPSPSAPIPNNPNENSQSQSQSQALTSTPHTTLPRTILYLIPLFIVLALLIFGALTWLIWGCCTRRPKYRYRRHGGGEVLSVSRPYPLPPSPGSRVGGVNWLEDDEKAGGGGSQATFRAFRYEDLPLPSNASFSYDHDDPWGDHDDEKIEEEEMVTTKCRHSREYGFRCDCRLSVIEREEVQRFRWPGVLPDVNEEDEEEDGGEGEGGDGEGGGRSRGARGEEGKKMGGRAGTFTPLDNLSPSTSTAIISPSSTGTELKSSDGYFDVDVNVTSTLGKQNKLFETLGLHHHHQQQQLHDAPKFGGRIMSRKNRRKLLKAKGTKSTKSTKTGRSSRPGTGKWTVGSVYSVDDVQDAEVDDEDTEGGDSEGFRMVIESPPPPVPSKPFSRGNTQRRARGDDGAPESNSLESGGSVGWMGKVANAFSRRGRNGGAGAGGIGGDADAAGEGAGEDRYTALPSPSTSPSTRTAGKRVNSKRSHLRRSARRQSSRVGHSDNAPSRHGIHEADEDEDEDMGGLAPDEMTEDELARQRRRLQNHRASIASLPKGMVYSPPLVQGVSIFCDDDESGGVVTAMR